MADKRIIDFPTLPEANDDDLILVSSADDTYNMKIATLKAAIKNVVEAAADNLQIGDGLRWDDGKLCVNTANSVEKDSTLPVTSGAVWMEIGNIEALLNTI